MSTSCSPWSARRPLTLGLGAGIVLSGALSAAGHVGAHGSHAVDFCRAQVDVESAVVSGDPDAIGPAVEALFAATPDELTEAVPVMVDNAPAGDGPPTPEFIDAYNEVVGYIKDNCGFPVVEVLAQDYSFGGLPEELPSGPTVLSLTNEGTEMHELIIARRVDGDATPIEDVLAGPPEALYGSISPLNGAFAAPGETGHAVFDLTPGDYVAICFIPVGVTAEVFEQFSAPGTDPLDTSMLPELGHPHFMEGMVQEFIVV